MDPLVEKIAQGKKLSLITHNGSFHYDEILATAFLMEIYGEDNVTVTRTRDSKIIDTGDIVYDVGAVCDPDRNRYDHHQREFTETYSDKYNIKLSSAGLIYKYFSTRLFEKYGLIENNELFSDVKEKIYKEFVLYADAIDNGYNIFGEIVPRTLTSLVGFFNSYDSSLSHEEKEKVENENFMEALKVVKLDLKNYLRYIFDDYVKSYLSAFKEVSEVTGEIYCTSLKISRDIIFDIDAKLKKNLKFVIFKGEEDFRIYALPVELKSFESRVPLHEPWRGLRNKDLEEVSKIPGCIFVHTSGFTGGNKTLEGAIEMCKVTLKHFNK